MAANLARAGVPLVVHDVNPAATAALETTPGVTVVRSAADAAARAQVLFTCLPDDRAVSQVYLGPDGVVEAGRPELVTADCSTVSAATTLEVHRALAARQIHHLDAPMLGSQPQAVAGEIFFIVGGERPWVERLVPYLTIMGRRYMHVGPVGTANRVKLVHNALAAVMSVAVAEALAVCVQAGVDPYVFYEVVRQGGGMAHSTYFERRAKRVLDGDFTPTFTAALMWKDVGLALDLARDARVPVPLLEETGRTYAEAVAAGWGREDFSAVSHVIERRIGRSLAPR
jgi:3-hydroxyisobutyrate dehydrogenase-like beta-hydroxyacid dehydrogenase